jgi:hypothetical protein
LVAALRIFVRLLPILSGDAVVMRFAVGVWARLANFTELETLCGS